MKTVLFFLTIFCFVQEFSAQGIGRISVNFKDASRTGGFSISGALNFPQGVSGRDIGTEIYYPALSNGVNAPIAPGTYPVIVFGHGFLMSWDAYQNIWEAFVPQGYIVAFPRTEGNISPSHADFGADLALVEVLIQEMSITSGNMLFEHVSPNAAIMGHSMGGGSTFLAASNNSSPTLKAIVGLAPAETNPSAVAAAANVAVDVLVLSGSNDGVTPPAQHHIPIYEAVNNTCKFFISLIGGGHCRFANANFNCDTGEFTSGGAGSLSRQQVHAITNNSVIPWLNFKLKGHCDSWTAFQNFISTGANINVTNNCPIEVFPVVNTQPSDAITVCEGELTEITVENFNADFDYQWFDSQGAIMNEEGSSLNIGNSGTYFVQATSSYGCSTNSQAVTVEFTAPVEPIFSLIFPVCAGGIVVLPTTSINGINGTWSPEWNANQTTTYFFTPDENACAEFTELTIEVFPIPEIDLSPTSTGLQATEGFVSYSWTFNGELIPNATGSSIETSQNGLYSVAAADENGCVATASFNATGLGFSDYQLDLAVYPNPSSGVVHISSKDNSSKEIYIFDLSGQLIFTQPMQSDYIQLNISNLAKGCYVLKVMQGEALNQYLLTLH